MDDLKRTVAENLIALRKAHHMTQLQLAETLHYSDKAVSKWERGESLPDLAVLKAIADLYGVTLDDLVCAEEERAKRQHLLAPDPVAEAPVEPSPHIKRHNRLIITGMAALLVWLIATLLFVILDFFAPGLRYESFLFLYALPITAIVCLVFNSIWFNRRWNYAIISVLLWSTLTAVYFTLYQYNYWKLFIIGIPAQFIIILWSRLQSGKISH